jgi:transcriptional regulator with XRE-family HTH domain
VLEPEAAFGQVLRELRLARSLSQEALALEAGLQRNYVSLLERGLNSATIKTLFKLAPVLGVTVSSLIEQVEIKCATSTRSGTTRRG